tara:strand:+ start:453 stop:749 length:297 start_codon:yes stop_codon:yes gene_type:complete
MNRYALTKNNRLECKGIIYLILHRQIWAIANDVRGAVDGWDFKLDKFDTLTNSISEGLTREIKLPGSAVEFPQARHGHRRPIKEVAHEPSVDPARSGH